MRPGLFFGICAAVFAAGAARADLDSESARTKIINLRCWQVRAILDPKASTSMELNPVGDRWKLSFIVACTEKECIGSQDRFEHFFSEAEVDGFGCGLKSAAGPVDARAKECFKQALLLKLKSELGFTEHSLKELRLKADLPKSQFTMQCRDEAKKSWFQKKLESWF